VTSPSVRRSPECRCGPDNTPCGHCRWLAEAREDHRLKTRKSLEAQIPPLFLPVTKPERLPDREAWAKAIALPGKAGRWLWLSGPSGSGKTRTAFDVLRAWSEELQAPGAYITAHELMLRAVEAAYASKEYAFVSEWSRVPVLFIDDLGNNRLTPSMESALFGVLNNRFAHVRPTVFTTQFLFKDLRKRFDNEKLAEALERRIAEHADVVFFRRKQPVSNPNQTNQ
jgi:DNA replication protein DnaC